MNKAMDGIITVAVAVIGLAALAVFVSKKADTSNVIKSAGSVFSNAIKTAVSPITGA